MTPAAATRESAAVEALRNWQARNKLEFVAYLDTSLSSIPLSDLTNHNCHIQEAVSRDQFLVCPAEFRHEVSGARLSRNLGFWQYTLIAAAT